MQGESESHLDHSTSAGQLAYHFKVQIKFHSKLSPPPPYTAELILDEENEDRKRKREKKTATQKG